MNNETQRRIKAYKAALPELRERVIAVALLLAMSASMLATASYAWITLSTAPEVSGMATTVAANGNLEIALAQGSVKEQALAPGESQVGDAASQQGIVKSNVTWGNLVNVSDPVYGLSNIALRPALLSDYNRTEYPLNGASYGGDGRVISTYDRYEYASYTKVEGSEDYYFAAGDKVNYGVRAISSVGYSNITGNVVVDNFRNTTNQYYRDAQAKYGRIVSDGADAYILDEASGVTCISALEGLVTVFAQDKINAMGYGPSGETKTSCSPYLWYVYQMMLLLEEVLVEEGNALLTMANWQAYVASGDEAIMTTFATIDDLLNASSGTLEAKGVKLVTLANYKKNLTDLRKCISDLYPMAKDCENPEAPLKDYYWDDIAGIVSKLVDINTATIGGKQLSQISGLTDAMAVLGGGDVIIYGGMLYEIELRAINNSNRVQADVKVKVKTNIAIMKNPTVKGTVYTNAYGKATTYSQDIEYSDDLKSSAKGDVTAKDTYGLAIDLWVRTNYPDAVLTLEGSVIYEDQDAFGVDSEGNQVELYTITVDEVAADVYQKDGVWYYSNGHTEVSSESMGEQTPSRKKIQVITGYQGENRIWEEWEDMLEAGLIEKDTTTQGAGSCFVFYADTPTEQAKIMEMLEAFNVVFIDQEGETLGTAQLNLESAYANQGKVTVPLEVITGTDYKNELGVDSVGIATLEQNVPTWITAIVYLNGEKLKNENVLASGELQGQLNIQFGTNATLVTPNNEELQSQYRTISASVAVNGQTTTNSQITLPYNAGGYLTTVTLTVDGEQPEHIKGYFVRVINATQGSRGDEFSFTKGEDGTWTANVTLTNPGSYLLNTLLVDGVQYNLHDGSDKEHAANHPKIYIEGLKLESASCTVDPGTYMTADRSKAFPVTAKIETAVPPKQVNAQFFSADNSKQYTALMSYDSINEQWVGTANINSSGTYTLKYISVDGQILEVPAQSQSTYTLYLGLTARISTTVAAADRTYIYKGEPVQMTMRARVFDDSGTPIQNLSGVLLTYNNILSPAEMEWQSAGYYEGVLNATKPGNLTFRKLELGEAGTLTSVSSAPTFMAISMELPKYISGNTTSKQTVIKSGLNATMTVNMQDAETADIWAEMTKKVGNHTETRLVLGAHDETAPNKITFTLPKEDGVWTMNRLLLQNVYDNTTATWYEVTTDITDETCYVISEITKLETDVVATVTTKLFYDVAGDGITDADEKTSDFTVDFSGTFLQEHKSNTLAVSVTDYKGRAIDGVEKASASKWAIKYNSKTSYTYGFYTGAADTTNEVALALSEDKTMLSAGAQTFRHAGVYSSSVTVNLGDSGTLIIPVQPSFTVTSEKPTVTVSSVSTNPTTARHYMTTTPSSLNVITGSFNKKIDDYSAVVYMYVAEQTGTLDQEQVAIKYPTVTLGLSGMPTDHGGTTMVVSNAANSSYAKTFTFAAGKTTATSAIGGGVDGVFNEGILGFGSSVETWPVFYPAGKQTVSQISVTFGDLTLVADLSHAVTINNPLYPNYAELKINDSTYTGTVPSRVYSENGETITLTLPTISAWSYQKIDSVPGTETLSSDTTDVVYTTASASIGRTKYTYYNRNVKKYTSTGTETTYMVTKEITGWKIGNTTYKPGQSVTVTGNQTIMAVITETHGTKTTISTTVTREIGTFTYKSSETKWGSASEGSKVTSVTNYEKTY